MMIMIPIPGDSVRTSDKGAPVVYLYFLGVMSHLSVLGQSGPGFSGLTFTAVFVQWRSAIDRPFGPFDLRQPSLPLLDRRVRPPRSGAKETRRPVRSDPTWRKWSVARWERGWASGVRTEVS